jgi:hypothetical protein
MPLDTPHPQLATTSVPNQDSPSPIQQEVVASIGTSIGPPLSEVPRPHSDTHTRATRTTPTLPPVQSIGEQSSICVLMASTDADPPPHQLYTGSDSPYSLFPVDQDHVSAFAPEGSVVELRVPVNTLRPPVGWQLHQSSWVRSCGHPTTSCISIVGTVAKLVLLFIPSTQFLAHRYQTLPVDTTGVYRTCITPLRYGHPSNQAEVPFTSDRARGHRIGLLPGQGGSPTSSIINQAYSSVTPSDTATSCGIFQGASNDTCPHASKIWSLL